LDLAQQFYVAYYGRAADPAGLEFWSDKFDQSSNIDFALKEFGESREFVDRFGDLNNSELINGIYQQAFGRDADSGGLEFYESRLESGQADLTTIAKQIIDGIPEGSIDDLIFSNKVAHAFCLTEQTPIIVTIDIDEQVEILSGVALELPECLAHAAHPNHSATAEFEAITLLGLTVQIESVGGDFF
jgi:hypothetical protein